MMKNMHLIKRSHNFCLPTNSTEVYKNIARCLTTPVSQAQLTAVLQTTRIKRSGRHRPPLNVHPQPKAQQCDSAFGAAWLWGWQGPSLDGQTHLIQIPSPASKEGGSKNNCSFVTLYSSSYHLSFFQGGNKYPNSFTQIQLLHSTEWVSLVCHDLKSTAGCKGRTVSA